MNSLEPLHHGLLLGRIRARIYNFSLLPQRRHVKGQDLIIVSYLQPPKLPIAPCHPVLFVFNLLALSTASTRQNR